MGKNLLQNMHRHAHEERFIGRIKRYVDTPDGGGYGFIDCEDTKLRFSRDVYIHKNQMAGFQIGDQVSFTFVRNQKGEPQARNLIRPEDAILLRPASQAVLAGPTLARVGQSQTILGGYCVERTPAAMAVAVASRRNRIVDNVGWLTADWWKLNAPSLS